MAITTSIAPSYGWKMIFLGVLCAVFGVWGGYDLWVKIPHQERVYARYEQLSSEIRDLEARQAAAGRDGVGLAPNELQALAGKQSELAALSPAGATPTKPSKFNKATQVIYLLCLPSAPYFFILFRRAKRQSYHLDDQGTLHFAGDPQLGQGTWPQGEIADIDMSIWMRKSIAHVVHADGRRLKLDAYLHKNLDRIIGLIANRLHPEQWDPEARPVKPVPGAEPAAIAAGTPEESAA